MYRLFAILACLLWTTLASGQIISGPQINNNSGIGSLNVQGTSAPYVQLPTGASSIVGFGPRTSSISSITVAGTTPCTTDVCTTTGLATGTAVGTFSILMAPATPTFTYTTPNISLATSGATCNATNGAGNASFQVVNDTLETNGTPAAGTYKICVNASQTGVPAAQQAFTVTVGNLIDAAAGVGTGGCTGSGTSASPWNYLCIQNAVNSSVNNDTVSLRGGNWALDTSADAAHVSIYNKAINVVGVASGNTFDSVGHVNNARPINVTCPTAGTSITCIYQTGPSYSQGVCADGAVTGNTHTSTTIDGLSANVLNRGWLVGDAISGSGIPANDTIATIATGGLSLTLAAATTTTVTGAALSTVRFPWNCSGYIQAGPNDNSPVPDPNCHNVSFSHIFFDGSHSTAGGDINALLFVTRCSVTTLSDVRFLGSQFNANGMGETQIGVANGSNNSLIQNSLFGEPIVSGSYNSSQGFQHSSDNGLTINNNVFYMTAPNLFYMTNLLMTDSYIEQGCDATGCAQIVVGFAGFGFSGVAAPGSSHMWAFNNYNNAGTVVGAVGSLSQGGSSNDPSTTGVLNDIQFIGNWLNGVDVSIDNCEWHIINSCKTGDASGIVSNQINGFTAQNNSIIGTSSARLTAIGSGCNEYGLGADCHTLDSAGHEIFTTQTVNFAASKNYLSSPSNQYNFDSTAITPSVNGNFCTGSTGGAWCMTTGFTQAPTASFTLGTLSGGTIPFATTNFTAQYGAVKWIASTSSTTPTSGDSRWWYVPPASIAAAHGNTVYMWVMDSANNISAAASQIVP